MKVLGMHIGKRTWLLHLCIPTASILSANQINFRFVVHLALFTNSDKPGNQATFFFRRGSFNAQQIKNYHIWDDFKLMDIYDTNFFLQNKSMLRRALPNNSQLLQNQPIEIGMEIKNHKYF